MSDVTFAVFSAAATGKVPSRQTEADTNSVNKADFIVVIPLVVECICAFESWAKDQPTGGSLRLLGRTEPVLEADLAEPGTT